MEVKLGKFKLTSNIIGVLDNENYMINFLKNLRFDNRLVVVDNDKLTGLAKRKFLNRVQYIEKDLDYDLVRLTVYQYMRHHLIENFWQVKDDQKKIMDSLSIVGLKTINLDQKVDDLSLSEKKLLQFATVLLSNPDILVFDHYLECFDLKLKKKIMHLFNQLTEDYHKIIILCSNNLDLLYLYTKELIIIKNEDKLLEGDTSDLLTNNIEFLLENGITLPEEVMFSYYANKKYQVRLNYHKDTRDLIKDIYKKV